MKNLSQEEMKKIISDVVSDYKKNNDIDISIRLVTKKEFYQEFLRMKKYKYYKVLDYLKLPFTSAAITEELSKNIYIFLDAFSKYEDREIAIYKLVNYCYHEIRHREQYEFLPYSYEKFLSDLENFYRRIYSEDYQINHNKYSFEIGANLFSLDRTMKYLNRYYKEVCTNSKVLDMYNRKYEENIFNYFTYDLENIINKVIDYNRLISKYYFKKGEIFNSSTISPVLKIFFYSNGEFKSINSIINNPNFSKLDEKIFFMIIASRYYKEVIDSGKIRLTKEEDYIYKYANAYQEKIKNNQKKYKKVKR